MYNVQLPYSTLRTSLYENFVLTVYFFALAPDVAVYIIGPRSVVQWMECGSVGGVWFSGWSVVQWVECGAVGGVWCSGWSVVLWVECGALSGVLVIRNISFIASVMESG